MQDEAANELHRRHAKSVRLRHRAKLTTDLPPIPVVPTTAEEDRTKHAAYMRSYYHRNKEKALPRLKERRKADRRAMLVWYYEQKAMGKCACGETNPLMLDYHHRDPTDKAITISQLVRRCTNKKRVLAEMAKCDLVCVRCHREHEYRELIAKYPEMPRYPGF